MARRPPPQFAHSATRSLVLTLIPAAVISAAPAASTARADNPSPAGPRGAPAAVFLYAERGVDGFTARQRSRAHRTARQRGATDHCARIQPRGGARGGPSRDRRSGLGTGRAIRTRGADEARSLATGLREDRPQ